MQARSRCKAPRQSDDDSALIRVRSSLNAAELIQEHRLNQVGLCPKMLVKRPFTHPQIVREIIHGDASNAERKKALPSLGDDASTGAIVQSRFTGLRFIVRDGFSSGHVLARF